MFFSRNPSLFEKCQLSARSVRFLCLCVQNLYLFEGPFYIARWSPDYYVADKYVSTGSCCSHYDVDYRQRPQDMLLNSKKTSWNCWGRWWWEWWGQKNLWAPTQISIHSNSVSGSMSDLQELSYIPTIFYLQNTTNKHSYINWFFLCKCIQYFQWQWQPVSWVNIATVCIVLYPQAASILKMENFHWRWCWWWNFEPTM